MLESLPDARTLALFVSASFLLAIIPGPDLIYIATRSMSQGRVAGIVSALGVHSGVLIHTFAAALGLSALIAASAIAFSIIKYIGAAYLIYLGIRVLLEKSPVADLEVKGRSALTSIYFQGVVGNLFNPKAVLFFLAYLPQFIAPEKGHIQLQVIYLGILFIIVNLPVDAAVGLAGGYLGNWLRNQPAIQNISKWVTGSVFIGLGIGTALVQPRRP